MKFQVSQQYDSRSKILRPRILNFAFWIYDSRIFASSLPEFPIIDNIKDFEFLHLSSNSLNSIIQ